MRRMKNARPASSVTLGGAREGDDLASVLQPYCANEFRERRPGQRLHARSEIGRLQDVGKEPS